jgi:hypothetical protein
MRRDFTGFEHKASAKQQHIFPRRKLAGCDSEGLIVTGEIVYVVGVCYK